MLAHCGHICQPVLVRTWRKENTFALLVGMQIGGATVESSVEIPQKLKNGFAFWPGDPTSGTISEGTQNTNLKEHRYPCVHCSVIYIAKTWRQPKCPSVDEWIKQLCDIYTMEYYLVIKKKEKSFSFCDNMDGPGECYATWNKPVRERQIPYDFTPMWNLMNKLN